MATHLHAMHCACLEFLRLVGRRRAVPIYIIPPAHLRARYYIPRAYTLGTVGLGAWIVYIVDTVYEIYIYLYPACTLGMVGLGAWIVYIVDDHYSVATCAAEDTPRALLAMLAYSGDLL